MLSMAIDPAATAELPPHTCVDPLSPRPMVLTTTAVAGDHRIRLRASPADLIETCLMQYFAFSAHAYTRGTESAPIGR